MFVEPRHRVSGWADVGWRGGGRNTKGEVTDKVAFAWCGGSVQFQLKTPDQVSRAPAPVPIERDKAGWLFHLALLSTPGVPSCAHFFLFCSLYCGGVPSEEQRGWAAPVEEVVQDRGAVRWPRQQAAGWARTRKHLDLLFSSLNTTGLRS